METQIFTTCHQCGKLIFIPQMIWDTLSNSANDKSNQTQNPLYVPPPPLKRNCNVTLYQNTAHSESVEQFKEEQSSFTFNNKNVYFPLCQDCSTTYIQHIKNYQRLFEKTSELIEKKFSDVPQEVFGIQFENAVSPPKDHKLRDASEFEIKKADREVEEKIVCYNKKQDFKFMKNPDDDDIQICLDPLNCDNPIHQEIPILKDMNSRTTKKFCPMISCFAFKIGANFHYGTINDLRIGFYKFSPNTILENNLALFFILHLMHHFKKAFNTEEIQIQLHPVQSISIGEQQIKKLIIPEGKKHIKYDELNEALHFLFVAFNIIKDASSCFPGSSMPPFVVDTELKTVGDVSYEYNPKTIESWSDAMKYLLIDMKMIQFRSLRSCFHH